MALLIEAISHRRFAVFGEKQLILGRSSVLHLPRLRRFSLEYHESLDCDRVLKPVLEAEVFHEPLRERLMQFFFGQVVEQEVPDILGFHVFERDDGEGGEHAFCPEEKSWRMRLLFNPERFPKRIGFESLVRPDASIPDLLTY